MRSAPLTVRCSGAEWYSYIDFLKWGWHAQMINQFENYPEGKPSSTQAGAPQQ